MSARQGQIALGLILALGLAVLLAYGHWSKKRNRATASIASAVRCETLANHIEKVRRSSFLGAGGELMNIEVAKRIRAASASVGVPRRNIHQINLSNPKPVPRSPYRRTDVAMKIRSVSLRQTLTLMWKIVETMPQLHVDKILLVEPKEKVGSQWNVEIGMSFLLYKP